MKPPKSKLGPAASHMGTPKELDHPTPIESDQLEQSDISSYGTDFYPKPELNKPLSGVSRGSEIKATFPTAPDDVELDKLFGFRKAKKLEGTFQPVAAENTPTPDGVVPHRIFVNHVDSYFGRHFVKFLQTQVFSFPRKSDEESDDLIEADVESEEEEGDEVEEEKNEDEEGRDEDLDEEGPPSLEEEDIEGEAKDEEDIGFGDFDEDPFAFLFEIPPEENVEIEPVESVFPAERSEILRPYVASENIGKLDLRNLQPEEYAKLLNIDREEERMRFLSRIIAKRRQQKAKLRRAKLERKKMRELVRKLKYSNTHKPFEIFGTLRGLSANERESEKLEYLKSVHIVDDITKDRDAFLEMILTCGTVVYSVLPCELEQAEQAMGTINAIGCALLEKERELATKDIGDLSHFLHTSDTEDGEEEENKNEEREYQGKGVPQNTFLKMGFEKNVTPRTFLLISTLMTWTNTIPLELEEADMEMELPFLESDFHRRRPHIHFRGIYSAENAVLNWGQKFDSKLKALVIDTGILYGHEEQLLDFFFIQAWRCMTDTPSFDAGNNYLPLIHIDKLSEIIYKLIRKSPFIEPLLIFACEKRCLKMHEICEAISILGTGRAASYPKELALMSPTPEMDTKTYAYLTSSVNVMPEYVQTLIPDFEDNFTENQNIAEEYILEHHLQPLRILINGLPLSGKTSLAMRLCKHYNIYYLSRDAIVNLYQDFLLERQTYLHAKLMEKPVLLDAEETLEEEDEEEEDEKTLGDEVELKEVEKKLQDLKKIMYDGPVTDDKVSLILADLLQFKRIRNIGYVLDGWPSTFDLVKKAFEGKDEIVPNIYINLEIQESVCMERIYNLSEDYFKEHPVDETDLIDRLFAQKELAETEPTLLDFFLEDGRRTRVFNIDANKDVNVARLGFEIGKPRMKQYWIPINEDIRVEEEERELEPPKPAQPSESEQREANFAAFVAAQIARQKREKEDEDKILAVYSERMRRYAARYLMPTLCRGLVETVRTRPADPVDFLAEYLFKHNPEGRMVTNAQKEIFGPEHITVTDEENFRKLQQKVACLELIKRRR